jgi:hypothetical protein
MSEKEAKLAIYEIKIEGHLKEAWAEWLNGMVVSIQNLNNETHNTTITVHVPDQAALRGVLNKLWDLNLTLLSVMLQGAGETGDKK